MTTPSETATDTALTRKPRDDEIDAYGLTHTGKVRQVNQDHFLIASLRKRMDVVQTSLAATDRLPLGDERVAFLMMVADGVGGGHKGEEASRVALAQVTQYVARSMTCYYAADARGELFIDELQEAAMQTHAGVLQRAQEHPDFRGMATTLTLVMGAWPWVYLLQVGDSRYYVYRKGQLTQITRDQTMAQELLDQGVLSRTEAYRTKWANVLSSAIGGQQTAPVVTRMENTWDNVHLLCSDGLTKHVSDERIAERLATMRSAKQVCEDLVREALEDGGTDNVTVLVGRALRKTDRAAG